VVIVSAEPILSLEKDDMENRTKVSIFNMFHDGQFVFLERNEQEVLFEIRIDFLAELLQPEYTNFKGILRRCRECRFEPWEGATIYEDIKAINTLIRDMDILDTQLIDEQVVINCYGMKKKEKGGDFFFCCDDIELFDQDGFPITVEKLEELSRKSVEDVP